MPIPILTIAQMRQWEKATWAAGRKEAEVISRVGHLVTVRARQMTRPGDLIVVLAGKGHNGDDARQISQNLSDREVALINVNEAKAGLSEFNSQLSLQPALIIDGLFGIGLNRPLQNDWVQLVEQINAARIRILSIDVPSGLCADRGEPLGSSIRATVTLTLGAPKRGLLARTAWPYAGRLEVAPDIGLVPFSPESDMYWTVREDFDHFPPERPAEGHKGTFGHVVIVAGSRGYHGASVLCARGASRAHPGLVSLLTMENVYLPVASQLQSAMVHPWRPGGKLPDRITALVFGPGLASSDVDMNLIGEMKFIWQEFPMPVLVDATGLNWIPKGAINSKAPRILTPHPGEAARLLKCTMEEILENRPKALHRLSELYGESWVVLKGHQTLVGKAGLPVYVNPSGNPLLAQGGSGDVLAGYLGGLLAQPFLQKDILSALRFGVWQHGAAADNLTAKQRNWVVEDLVNGLGGVAN